MWFLSNSHQLPISSFNGVMIQCVCDYQRFECDWKPIYIGVLKMVSVTSKTMQIPIVERLYMDILKRVILFVCNFISNTTVSIHKNICMSISNTQCIK